LAKTHNVSATSDFAGRHPQQIDHTRGAPPNLRGAQFARR